nr:hypothetical protein [Ramlibacter sp.]
MTVDVPFMLRQVRDLAPAPHFDAERGRAPGQDRLQGVLVDPAHAPLGLTLRA